MICAPQTSQDHIGADLLIGAEAIATELNMAPHEIYYAHRKKILPIGKLGSKLIASKNELRRAMRAITCGGN
jgi:hypothetical protein